MRPLLLPITAAALLALAGVLAATLLRSPAPADRDALAAQLAAELRCPDCAGLSVAESRTPAAAAIRAEIGELLDAGATPDAVRQHFVDRYGEWILLVPPDPWIGWLPWVALVGAVAAGAAWLTVWRGRREAAAAPSSQPGPGPSAAVSGRLREELEELDA